jgi:Mg2+/Co2+ transporter CorB
MSISHSKAAALLESGKRGSRALKKLKDDPRKLIITILIGNNIVNIGSASLATYLFTNLFGSSGVGIATGVMTLLILTFGEIAPKTLAIQKSETISLIMARPLQILSILLTPLVIVFEFLSSLMSKVLGVKSDEKVSEEELRSIVTLGRDEGILSKEAAKMMHNVLEFEGTLVTEVMTPKVDVRCLDGNKSISEVLDDAIKAKFSRFPVYVDSPEKIIGVLDLDDLLKFVKENNLSKKISDIASPAYIVPESKEIDSLLIDFDKQRINLAIVVDEYGSLEGIVTVEDILEEIVGEIFDSSRSKLKSRGKSTQHPISGKTPINMINRLFEVELEADRFDTIAGYIEQSLKRLPDSGEAFAIDNLKFKVVESDKHSIKKVQISKK